jgi:hypothetical protein
MNVSLRHLSADCAGAPWAVLRIPDPADGKAEMVRFVADLQRARQAISSR